MLIGGFLLDVIIAKHAGVCFGAKMATGMAFKAARNYRNHVYSIGPRVRNPQVVKQLREAALIRSHGLPFRRHVSDGVLRFIKAREALKICLFWDSML